MAHDGLKEVRLLECLEGCDFQRFGDNRFYCKYYDKVLVSEMGAKGSIENILVYRCKECVEEGKIGSSREADLLAGIRSSLVYLGDHFYSFKDAFEDDLATLYRNLKALEDRMKGE